MRAEPQSTSPRCMVWRTWRLLMTTCTKYEWFGARIFLHARLSHGIFCTGSTHRSEDRPLHIRSAPDAPGSFDDKLEFVPLAFFGDEIPFRGGRKTALRAKSEIFQGYEASGFVDTFREVVCIFHLRNLGADQAEHHRLSLGNEAQGREGSGTRVVIFEKETIDLERAEQFFGDGVVATLGVPVAAIVSAAEVDR